MSEKESNRSNNEENFHKHLLEVLTPRQYQVAVWVGQGLTSGEIAEAMNIKERTVEKFRQQACRNLGIEGRGTLYRLMVNNGAPGHS